MKTNLDKKAIVVIFLAAVVLGFIYNHFSADGISFIRKPLLVENVESTSAEAGNDNIKGLILAQVIELQAQNVATFIDARDQWDYSEGHIKGAINIPEFSFEPSNKLLKTIEKDKLIIVYCDGDECDTSKRLANRLMELGYKNTFVFLGGMNEWIDAELPIVKERINE